MVALTSLGVSAVWLGLLITLSRNWPERRTLAVAGAVVSLAATVLAAPGIWPKLLAGYPGDSYWTLGWGGRAGVAAISSAGLAALFLLMRWKTRALIARIPSAATCLAIDLVLGALMFGVLYSVSPQAFYSFYRLVIPGLPQQWVIDGPLDLERLRVAAQLSPDARLSDHLAGAALWATTPFTVWLHWKVRRADKGRQKSPP